MTSRLTDTRPDAFDQLLGARRGAGRARRLLARLRDGRDPDAVLAELDRLVASHHRLDGAADRQLLDGFIDHLVAARRDAWGQDGIVETLAAFSAPTSPADVERVWSETHHWMRESLSGDPSAYFDGSGLSWFYEFADGQVLSGIGQVCAPHYAADPVAQTRRALGGSRWHELSRYAQDRDIDLEALLTRLDERQWWVLWSVAMPDYAAGGVGPGNTGRGHLKALLRDTLKHAVVDHDVL